MSSQEQVPLSMSIKMAYGFIMMTKLGITICSALSANKNTNPVMKNMGGFICFFSLVQFFYTGFVLFTNNHCGSQVTLTMSSLLFFLSILQVMEAKQDTDNIKKYSIGTMTLSGFEIIAVMVIIFLKFKD